MSGAGIERLVTQTMKPHHYPGTGFGKTKCFHKWLQAEKEQAGPDVTSMPGQRSLLFGTARGMLSAPLACGRI
eukprot:3073875-Amphidinium_carterae.2